MEDPTKAAPVRERRPARSASAPAGDDRATAAIDLAGIDKVVGYVVRRAQIWIFKDVKRAFQGLDISPAQFTVLKIVHANPGLAQARVADALSIERARLVLMLDRLEARGLLQRVRSDVDRRSHALHLTEAGRKLLGKLDVLVREHDRRVVERLGPEGVADVLRILAPLLD